MLTTYIAKAMAKAEFEDLEENEGVFASIPGFEGLWAKGVDEGEARQALQAALEDWILVGVSLHHELPIVDDIRLVVKKSA